jgi:hypothetical protein
MTTLSVIPQEFFDGVTVPRAVTLDGELIGALDDTPAGPWLAEMLAAVDSTRLTTLELPGYLRACYRMQAWSAAQLAAGVAEHASRPDAIGPDKDIALALQEPVGAALRRIWWGRSARAASPRSNKFSLVLLPHAHSLQANVTAGVDDPDLLAKIEERVLPSVGKKTADELARIARDAVKRLDPVGAQRRAKAARDQADVQYYPDPHGDGMSDVVIHAPAEDALIVKNAVDAYASSAKAGGDPRPIGVLRAEAPVHWASNHLTGRTNDPSRPPTAAGRPIEIGITVPLRVALGLDDLPGELPGLGIIPRTIIAEMLRRELPKLRLLVIDPDNGRLLHRATSSYRPTADQVAQVRATYVFSVGPGSKILAVRTDTDHPIPYPVGPTMIGNLIPLDRPWHVGKTRGELSVTVDHDASIHLTTVSGQTRTVTPYDYRMTDTPPTDRGNTAEGTDH